MGSKTTDMTTIEGNRLIHAFMNYPADMSDYCVEGRPNYSTSWDWLMPVVEKIEKNTAISIRTNNWNNNGQYQCYIHKCFDMKTNNTRGLIVEKTGSIKINVVWQAVIDYIKYYNDLMASYGNPIYNKK